LSGDGTVIRSTILTVLVLSNVAIASPGLLSENTLAFAPPSSKEITLKQDDSMEISDATYAQQVENAHNSCHGVAKEKGFRVNRVLHTNSTNDPTQGAVVEVFMDLTNLTRQSRSYRAKCIYNPSNGQAHISGLGIVVRK